jgi:putative N6-adenine-specific DNA methylase
VIKINGQSPLFNNTLFAAQLLKDAICDKFREEEGERPSVSLKEPYVGLHLFLDGQQATVYFDTSLEPLFKRGWRREAVEAPLQETMAAAVLRLAGYTGAGFLCDPCCGGGTILIEAALIATKTAPGFYRTTWGFEKLKEHDAVLWQKVKDEADSQRIPLRANSIFGIDFHKDALRVSKVNLIGVGLQDEILLTHSNFAEAEMPERFDLLVANPPHGERLGEEENLVPLYRALGDFIKHKGKQGAKAFVYTSSLALSKEIGLKADKRHVICSSGQECRVIELSVKHSDEIA